MAPDLSEITIVIPTLSRPKFVLRQFEYWRNHNAQVVILDGAAQPISIPPEMECAHIRYLHTGETFNQRLANAGEHVKTRYCALLPDDEFFLPNGLTAAILKLDQDQSVVGCVGRCLYFFVDQGRFLVRDAYRDWAPFPVSANSVYSRLDADLPPRKTHMATYAVMRSNHWSDIFRNSYRVEFSSAYTYERLTNLQRSIRGRTELLEDLLWMRSMENPPIDDSTSPRSGGRDFVSWATNPFFSSEVSLYRNIALDLITSGVTDRRLAKELEHRFFVGGVHRQAMKEQTKRRIPAIVASRAVSTLAPMWLRNYAKRFVPPRVLRFTGWEGFGLDLMCDSLSARGTNFVREDLDRVMTLVLKSSVQPG